MTTLAPPPRSKLTVEIVLRSMVFTVWVYGLGAVMGLACLPLLAAPA
jgi:hypothetical protein